MSEPCAKKVLGIFTVYHHNWGPWKVSEETHPLVYRGSEVEDRFVHRYVQVLTRQCLSAGCGATQIIKDPPDLYHR